MDEQFAKDVREGLTAKEKYLYSKYFYDEPGDLLFKQITMMPEYYLTGCEEEILETNRDKFIELFGDDGNRFNLIEFGAGDGLKTRILLRHFMENHVPFRYCPIDISANVLEILVNTLEKEFPGIYIDPVNDEYFGALDSLEEKSRDRKIILFLGANIGNFIPPVAVDFLTGISGRMKGNDLLLTGFDIKKDPREIVKAYNDPKGVTADFNFNLLLRINSELGGNFNIENFYHYPLYDPSTGETKSFLISKKEQNVYIEKIKATINFYKGEHIYMEVSQKYSINMIEDLAVKSGLRPVKYFFDKRKYFTDVLFKPANQ